MKNLDLLVKEYVSLYRDITKKYLNALPTLKQKFDSKEIHLRQTGVSYQERKELKEFHQKRLKEIEQKLKLPPPQLYPEDLEDIKKYGMKRFISIFKINL